ncbi:MAG: hypothetical protein U5L45_24875 [Saprospiraceae bacterium]|nr:hypothetical protein [Saprospiraceae bacterium]
MRILTTTDFYLRIYGFYGFTDSNDYGFLSTDLRILRIYGF